MYTTRIILRNIIAVVAMSPLRKAIYRFMSLAHIYPIELTIFINNAPMELINAPNANIPAIV